MTSLLPRALRRIAPLGLCFVAACTAGAGGGGGSGDFELELRYLGDAPTGATLTAFENAAASIRATITAGLTSVSIPSSFTNVSQCEESLTGFPDVPRDDIPGLVIYVRVTAIDGVGNVLGSAGPCLVRPDAQDNLPALGVMRFDEADLANLEASGRLQTVILHEMLHVLGFGTIWTDNGVLDSTNVSDPRFTGPRARAACANVHSGGANCATNVPVHAADGEGSAFSHWRESLFTNELMTPFLTAGSTPFSEMTIRSLADLGYVISVSQAQPFTVSGTALRAEPTIAEQGIRLGEPLRPRWKLDNSGDLVPYRPR